MHDILQRTLRADFLEAGLLDWPEKGRRRHGRSHNLLDLITSMRFLHLLNGVSGL